MHNKYLKDGFVYSISPYRDICFVICKNEHIENEIKKRCSLLSLTYIKRNEYICIGYNEKGSCSISGYGKIGNNYNKKNYFIGDADVEYSIKDAVYGIGNFTFFKLKGNCLFACHDYFGLGNIYTYQDDNMIIVSNRSHLVSIFSFVSNERKINQANIKTIVLHSHHFRQDTLTEETPIYNLRRVFINNAVVVYGKKLYYIKRKKLKLNDTYENLILKAKKSIYIDFYHLLNKIGDEKKVVFDLSGGKDSRACIAPFISENIAINTQDVGNDLNISNIIVSIYDNLQYCNNFNGKCYPIDQHDSLCIYRSCFMGAYNRMTLVRFCSFGEINNIIASGGCGELYRTYWNVNKPEKCKSFNDWIYYILDKKEYIMNKYFVNEKKDIVDYIMKELQMKE